MLQPVSLATGREAGGSRSWVITCKPPPAAWLYDAHMRLGAETAAADGDGRARSSARGALLLHVCVRLRGG